MGTETQQNNPPDRDSSLPALQLHAAPSEDQLAQGLLDLFRSVGYAAVYPGSTITSDVDAATNHIVIAGPDAGPLRALLDALAKQGDKAAKVLIVARPGFSATALMPGTRRLQVIEGGGDLYEIFERIAVPLGLEVRTDVFLSYSRRSLIQAENLTQALLDRGRVPVASRARPSSIPHSSPRAARRTGSGSGSSGRSPLA